jgi:hypothetical protein
MVFEKEVKWKTFETMKKEVTGKLRKQHNEEVHNL